MVGGYHLHVAAELLCQRSETLKNSDMVSVLQRMAIKTSIMCPLSFYSETRTLAIGFNVTTTPRYMC